MIMTVYDTVKGALAGFEEDGFLGGLQGAIEGFLNSVIGAPLDLLKDVVAWVLKKFGFDETADALKDFSFSDMISKIVDTIFDLFKTVINGFLEVVASGLDFVGMGDKVREYKLGTNTKELAANQEAIDDAEGRQKFLNRKEKNAQRAFDSTYRAAMRDGEISAYEQQRIDKQAARLEKAQSENEANTAELERLRAERQELQGGGTTIVDNSDNSSTSSSDASYPDIAATPLDAEDPYAAPMA